MGKRFGNNYATPLRRNARTYKNKNYVEYN